MANGGIIAHLVYNLDTDSVGARARQRRREKGRAVESPRSIEEKGHENDAVAVLHAFFIARG